MGAALSDQPLTTLLQEDTFFKVPSGRLKLREFPDYPAMLIFMIVSMLKAQSYLIITSPKPKMAAV